MRENYLKFKVLIVFLSLHSVFYGQDCANSITNSDGPDTLCSGNPATLTATSNGDQVYWFDAATNGTLLHTGSPYQTNSLSTTRSFWVESRKTVTGSAVSGGAKAAPTSTSGSSVVTTTSPWGLVFNATQSFVLNSVDVFITSATEGSLVINLKDSNQTVLETLTVATPAGGTGANIVQFTVPLNFTIPVGNGYRLLAVSSPSMVRDLGSNSFPFALGTVGSVTQGTINNSLTGNPGVYYFFYNWNYSPIETCTSTRQEVAVTVTPSPSLPTGTTPQTFTPGETIADIEVTGTNLTWYSDSAGTTPLPTTTPLVHGVTYYVRQQENGCSSALLGITVSSSLSVGETSFSELRYYPNPVNNTLFIRNSEEIASLEVFNLLGQKLLDRQTNAAASEIDLSSLSKGSYLLKINSSSGQTKTIKIVKS